MQLSHAHMLMRPCDNRLGILLLYSFSLLFIDSITESALDYSVIWIDTTCIQNYIGSYHWERFPGRLSNSTHHRALIMLGECSATEEYAQPYINGDGLAIWHQVPIVLLQPPVYRGCSNVPQIWVNDSFDSIISCDLSLPAVCSQETLEGPSAKKATWQKQS